MISLLIRFALVVTLAIAFAWLADQPGDLTLRWLGYEIQTSLMAALITISIFALVIAAGALFATRHNSIRQDNSIHGACTRTTNGRNFNSFRFQYPI